MAIATLALLILLSGSYIYSKNFNSSLRIPILMYHHISENPNVWSDSTVSPEKFREDMLYLKALGYEAIHFKDFLDYQEKGSPLPENPIFITFDDGYLSNYEYAYPILKELNLKATISVIGWSRGRSHHLDNYTKIIDHFSWEQAKEMYDSGIIDIQHHTYDLHSPGDTVRFGRIFNRMPQEEQKAYREKLLADTILLKDLIEEHVGNEVNVFVYPFGVFNRISEEVLKDLGFKVTITTLNGISDLSKGLFLLNRINMPHYISSPDLMAKITEMQGRRVDIPFRDVDEAELRIEKLEELLKNNS